MKKLKLYLETSLFGFYSDTTERNIDKSNAVKMLFNQIRLGLFEGYVSDITYYELAKSAEPFRKRDLALINQHDLGRITADANEVETLTNLYLEEKVLPGNLKNDLIHMAYSVVTNMNVLVTYNCQHIANVATIRKMNAINMKYGYYYDISIVTPEEVIFYDK